MDRVSNPFQPGAGSKPPELAGRASLIDEATIAIKRVSIGKTPQSLIMVGLRGVGKTVLLCRYEEIALDLGCKTIFIETREGEKFPQLLAQKLRSLLGTLSMIEGAKKHVYYALQGLKGFLNGLRINVVDAGLSLGVEAVPGFADQGDIETDLPDLMIAIAQAAKAANTTIILIIDELQYLKETEFSALIVAMHRINQKGLPVLMMGAGLPQIRALAGNSKSYAERLFRFLNIGALNDDDAREALQRPATAEQVIFTDAAIAHISKVTERYPYFLQQWAYTCWNISDDPVINETTAQLADKVATAELDESFFKVRLERCTPSEKKYMRALAGLGSGKQRSGDIAEALGVKPQSIGPTRSSLIKKGMIYSPSHGDTEFTVPMFDRYMKRVIP